MSEKTSMFELLNERMTKEEIIKIVTSYDNKFNELEEENKRLNNIINELDEYANKLRYYADEDDEEYKISKDIHNILQELKGSDKK